MLEQLVESLERELLPLVQDFSLTTMMRMAFLREICRPYQSCVLVRFVQRRHALRVPRDINYVSLGWEWAECKALETVGERLPDWDPWVYQRDRDALTVRGSALLFWGEEHIPLRDTQQLVVLSLCLSKLMGVYTLEPPIFERLYALRSLVLAHLALRLPPYGVELN